MMWWYSQDEEFWGGPCETREDAVDIGRAEYGGEGFMVCEAEQGEYNLTIPHRSILELLERVNEKMAPSGCIFDSSTDEQIADLETMVSDAISAWADKHGLSKCAWAFTKQGKIEDIPAEDADCTCRQRVAGPTDIDPPEGKIRDRNCPDHGRDPDAERERQQDREP